MKVNAEGRNVNLVIGMLNREGLTRDETRMLEWKDVVALDSIALTETKMVKHEVIYPLISIRRWKVFATKAIETQTEGTPGRKGRLAILVNEYPAEHTIKLEEGIKATLLPYK